MMEYDVHSESIGDSAEYLRRNVRLGCFDALVGKGEGVGVGVGVELNKNGLSSIIHLVELENVNT